MTNEPKGVIMNVSNEREENKMKVSRNEMIRIRKNLLRQMDTFVRENISEDVVIDIWLACGLEDGWERKF